MPEVINSKANTQINLNDLSAAIRTDPLLPPAQKQTIMEFINIPNFVDLLKGGAFGAGLFYAVSKFLGLSKKAQLLLAAAGFGIGKALLDVHDRVFKFNAEHKSYQV
jgi:hypothetical protein